MSETQEKLNKQLFNVIVNENVSDEARLKKLKYLLYLGADLEARNYGCTVLIVAAQKGQIGVVKYLAENGADIEARDNYERTALDIARKWEKADCVEFLEEYQKKNSARINQGDKTGGSQIVKKNEGR